MRDVDLRGKTTVAGVPLDQYVKKLVTGCPAVATTTVGNGVSADEVKKIVTDNIQQLDAFHDEKVMLADNIMGLTKRMSVLEERFEELYIKVTDMKPKRGVDQATLDAAVQELKNEVLDILRFLTKNVFHFHRKRESYVDPSGEKGFQFGSIVLALRLELVGRDGIKPSVDFLFHELKQYLTGFLFLYDVVSDGIYDFSLPV